MSLQLKHQTSSLLPSPLLTTSTLMFKLVNSVKIASLVSRAIDKYARHFRTPGIFSCIICLLVLFKVLEQ